MYASVRKTNIKTTILVAPGEYFGLQVTGMIEGFFGGLIFDSADVWVGKLIWQVFFRWFDLSRDF